ncbi:MAG: glycosyltransferase family 4 protein [Roseiflexaceae bacterium]|nr:glycosyltransferase family 4 protein [Roseiflexaceae bacterium]
MTAALTARIGFVSTRLAGTDGVSLEVVKWVTVLRQLGHQCFFFAGELDWPSEISMLAPEAHFIHPDVAAINADLFDDYLRSSATSQQIQAIKERLKRQLYAFIQRFDLTLLIPQNALAIPMNVPLGLALTEVIAETGIPTIAHHHDFSWERVRFAVSAAEDVLSAAFPPALSHIRHVVINSPAARQLAMRRAVSSTLIPNVMPFEQPPPPADDYSSHLRADLGIAADELLVLQPTRVVPRKRIERAIELVARLARPATLLISHEAGDEGLDYGIYLRDYAELLGVHVLFGSDLISERRGTTATGQRVYSLADAYQHSDFVTYPSVIEGFGNAFLEALYFRRPIVLSAYDIYRVDIQPKGFQVIQFEEFITSAVVQEVQALLGDQPRIQAMVEHNYELACRFYSYSALEKHLAALLNDALGM